MIELADGDLVVPTDRAVADRACTDAESHDPHPWTDGLRAWSCPGREEIQRPAATVTFIALTAGTADPLVSTTGPASAPRAARSA